MIVLLYFQRIRDYQLVGIVLVLVIILCLVLVSWEIIDPLFMEIRFLENEVACPCILYSFPFPVFMLVC